MISDYGELEEEQCVSDTEQPANEHHQIVSARYLHQVVQDVRLSIATVGQPIGEVVVEKELVIRGIKHVPVIARVRTYGIPAQKPDVNGGMGSQDQREHQPPL